MRFVVIVGALVLILAMALPAYAETQSVKVSGDLTIRGIYRKDFDLDSAGEPNGESFGMSTAEVQIDADLTDNVSTVIRIVNQRNWGDSDRKQLDYYDPVNVPAAPHQWIAVGHSLLDLGIDLAYIQIKELFFEPVTIRLGRQDLWFGRGLVIGANQVDPGYVDALLAVDVVDQRRGIGSPELTAFNAFDAARMTIDFEQYAPFVVDLVYIKNDENRVEGGGDVDVYGINAGYTWDVYDAEAEGYYWLRDNGATGNPFTGDDDETHTVGVRGSFKPNEEFIFGGEAAYQFGDYVGDPGQAGNRERKAYLLNAFVEYLGWTKYMYSPKVSAEWIFLSGDRDPGEASGNYGAWNPMYRGYYPLLIRPFQGYYYFTHRFPGGQDLGLTNQHEFIVKGSIQPLDDVTLEATVGKYYFDETPVMPNEPAAMGGHDIGTELDILSTYDYTEDVTFSLLTAWFFPGDVYEDQGTNRNYPAIGVSSNLQEGVASEVIGSCKVSF